MRQVYPNKTIRSYCVIHEDPRTDEREWARMVAKRNKTQHKELLLTGSMIKTYLRDAIDDYDPTRGFRFITYASYFIRRQMNHYANFVNVTLYSGNKCRYQSKVKEINREYFNEFGFYPSLDTIKEIFNEKYGIAVKSVNDLYHVVVEDIDFSNEDDMTCSAREKEFNFATYSTNNYLDNEESEFMHNAIMSSLSILKPREQDIIQMFFGIGEYTEPSSSSTIAKKYNMTASAVNMIKQRALDKLKDVLTYKLAC
jgi:RNA polymerase sigma factor (sigma-70 family)